MAAASVLDTTGLSAAVTAPPGVDGTRAHHVRAFGVELYLSNIRALLKAARSGHLPVRERMIPKTGGKLRRLGSRPSRIGSFRRR